MKNLFKICLLVFCITPRLSLAQGSAEVESFHQVLERLYEDMLPLCERLIDVARGLAGFAALWFIGSRVWRHLANAEPIDFYPLLRPFAIGLAILLFPGVLSILNGILKPTVLGTASMMKDSNLAIEKLLQLKEEAIRKTPLWQMYVGPDGNGDRERWYRYSHGSDNEEGVLDAIGNDMKFAMEKASYNFRNAVKQWMSEVLQIFFEAAALCINTIRTFYLVVLSVLGPIVFGISVFDGLHQTLMAWLARYINVFLWLPVANIFGSIIAKIQENMLRIDIGQVESLGDTFFSTSDTAYIIFLIIGIIGYFTVPSVAGYIVHAGGSNALVYKVSSFFSAGGRTSAAAMGSAFGSLTSYHATKGTSNHGGPSANFDGTGNFMENKLSGKP